MKKIKVTLMCILLALFRVVNLTRITTQLEQKITSFANEALGVDQLQTHLNENVLFETNSLDGANILEEVANVMEDKYSYRVSRLASLAQSMTSVYTDGHVSENNPFLDCCDENAIYPHYDEQLGLHVNYNKICVTGTGLRGNPTEIVPESMVETWKEMFTDDHPFGIQWIYYGSEEGVMYNYPAVKKCDPNYDPRYRPFYIETVTPIPKDVVIVIDRSGSMGDSHNGQTLMNIAIDAARTVIDTLNINDRVGIVAFSDDAETPSGLSSTSDCYANEIARATVENKNYLKQYLSQLTPHGETYYRKSLAAAFGLMENAPPVEDDVRDRNKVILFLTDGKPSDCDSPMNASAPGYGYDCGYIYQDIREMNARLNNSVIILTYGMGQSIDAEVTEVLENIAKQILYDEQQREVTRGLYTWVNNPDNLREKMASYYNMFVKVVDQDPHVHFTVPYQDAFGSGIIASMCRYVNKISDLKGVICMDESVHGLLSDLTYAQVGQSSYPFMVDIYTRVLYHPYTEFENEITNHPKFTFLRALEIDNGGSERIGEMITSIINEQTGNVTATTKTIIGRGDALLDGVYSHSQVTHYFWRKIERTKYVIGVAMKGDDIGLEISWTNDLPQHFLYHKLSTQQQSGSIHGCSHFNALSVQDEMSVHFALRAMTNPYKFMFDDEDIDSIHSYREYFTDIDQQTNTFKNQIREHVAATSQFRDILLRAPTRYKHIALWRYFATENGIFTIFPAVELPKMFDATQRQWYKQTKSNPQPFTITRPYNGTYGEGFIVTLSKVIVKTIGESVEAAIGVIGMDFSPQYLYKLIEENVDRCTNNNCFLVDKSGFIVAHPDWMDKYTAQSQMLNIHIAEKEPLVALKLIKNLYELKYMGCINIFDIRQQFSWRLDGNHNLYDYHGDDFETHMVAGTNVLLIIKLDLQSQPGHCFSCNKQSYPLCARTVEPGECFCPCHEMDNTNYFYCQDVFSLSSDDSPICLPPLPAVDFSVVPTAQQSMDVCYTFDCTTQTNQRDCNSYMTCNWCIHRDVTSDVCDESRMPSCVHIDECAADQTVYDAIRCTTTPTTTTSTTSRTTSTTDTPPTTEQHRVVGDQQKQDDSKEKTPGWAIGLIVLGILLLVALIAIPVVVCLILRNHRDQNDDGIRNYADNYATLPDPNPHRMSAMHKSLIQQDIPKQAVIPMTQALQNIQAQSLQNPDAVSRRYCTHNVPAAPKVDTPDVTLNAQEGTGSHGTGSQVTLKSDYLTAQQPNTFV